MSKHARLGSNVGLTIRRAFAPVCSPDESEQELIKEYAECQSNIMQLPCRPPNRILEKMEDVEQKWARHGLRRQTLYDEASNYLFPLRCSSDTIEVDGVIVGCQKSLPDVEDARSPHFLCVDTETMYRLQDEMWYKNIDAPNTSVLLKKARQQAREERVGRLSSSDYL